MRRLLVSLLVLGACAGAAESPAATTSSSASAPSPIPTNSGSSVDELTQPSPTSPPTTSPTTVDPTAVLPSGFELVAARVVEPDGTVCEICLWLADTSEQRRRGLMSVTDLGGAAGMAFRYERPHTTRFWMKDTPLPLSIAFFDPEGAFMQSFDMEPCLTAGCPRYPTPPDFLVAVETYQGGLPSIGMLEGSTLELLDLPCPT